MELNENKTHILVIDDDERIRTLLSRYLKEHDYLVSTAEDTKQASTILKDFIYDLLIVDVMMPGETGFEFGQRLRQRSDVPILYLTAKAELSDKVEGFESGGDDYLSKPFEPQELLLRINAILKRKGLNIRKQDKIEIGEWIYNKKTNSLSHGESGKSVSLTDVESKLLQALLMKKGQIVSRDDLALLLGTGENSRTIDVQVTRLRRKIEKDPKQPRLLQTVRGKGYILHA